MDYKTFNEKKEKEFNEFINKYVVFAFGLNYDDFIKSFNKNMNEKFNDNSLTFDDFISIGNGGYLLNSKKNDWINLVNQYEKEYNELLNDDKFVYDLFYKTLSDHEYIITYDDLDVFYYSGFVNTYDDETFEKELNEIENKERIIKIYNKARKQYLKDYEKYN